MKYNDKLFKHVIQSCGSNKVYGSIVFVYKDQYIILKVWDFVLYLIMTCTYHCCFPSTMFKTGGSKRWT